MHYECKSFYYIYIYMYIFIFSSYIWILHYILHLYDSAADLLIGQKALKKIFSIVTADTGTSMVDDRHKQI